MSQGLKHSAGRPFFPTRARGQNFLHDRGVARRFATAAFEAGEPGAIVEIGPGKGALTLPLLEAGARVLAIEVDPRLAEVVRERSERAGFGANLELVVGDALRLDLPAVLAGAGFEAPVPLAGNLPFSVATLLLLRLLPVGTPLLDPMTLSFQQEVAARVLARPGDPDYGALSVVVARGLVAESCFRIHPAAFRPRPRVVSEVVRLTARKDPLPVGDPDHFRRLVRGLFAHRRKTLRNGVARLPDRDLGARVEAARRDLELDPGLRPDELSVEDFAAISRLVSPC